MEPIGQLEILALTRGAVRTLAELFEINPKITLVPSKRAGSYYDAEFYYPMNTIFLDVPSLAQQNLAHVVHTVGEEVGHALHFHLLPQIFMKSDPSHERILEAITRGIYRDLFVQTIEASNLTEFVGFFSGLYFLRQQSDSKLAKEYADIALKAYESYIPERFSVVHELADNDARSVEAAYQKSPLNIKEQVLDGAKDKRITDLMSHLKHGFGYWLASKVYTESDRGRRYLKIALKCKKFSQLHRRLLEKEYV